MPTAAIRDFPTELQGLLDPRVYQRLQQLFNLIYDLQQVQRGATSATEQVVKRQLQLLGVFREPLLGNEVADPQLAAVASAPGAGTVTSLTPGTNITMTPNPITGTGSIAVVVSPSFTNVNATGVYQVGGTQVVSARGAAVADAVGGATIDAEARTAINTLLARLRVHGLIA